jgi:hypothetical protein
MVDYKSLVRHGFVKKDFKNLYSGKKEKEINRMLSKMEEEDIKKHADTEWIEVSRNHFGETDYPKPLIKYRLIFSDQNFGVEEMYFWVMRYLQSQHEFSYFEKVIDTYAASESSAYFGMMQTRISAQQTQASQYLKGISDMIKSLFQIVREIRILDERMQFYKDTYDENKNKESSEIVLKGLWIDQVEGGSKNPSSVYGLASTVGFVILPDLFFRVMVKNPLDLDEKVNSLQFNEKIKEVLKRKLRQYYEWKTRTYKELEVRRKFIIKYLRQHYDTIQLYISWIKPYIRNINRMQAKDKHYDAAELITSFEGAISEIEVIIRKKERGCPKFNSVVLASFLYVVQPKLDYHMQEYQYKGPVHVGKVDMNLRAYSWTDEQIKAYKAYREDENMQILGSIDASIKEAIDSLGEELKTYLTEAGEKFEKEEAPEKEEKKGFFGNIFSSFSPKKKEDAGRKVGSAVEPFVGVFKGFAEIITSFGVVLPSIKKKEDEYTVSKEKNTAGKAAGDGAFYGYHYYKKAHRMTAW